MTRKLTRLMAAGAIAAILATAPAFAEPKEIKGVIVTHENGQLTVKSEYGDQTIALTPDTKVRSISGPLGGQRDDKPVTALIPGLPVSIDADDATGQLTASKVEYKQSDYKTAVQIQAGIQETERRTEELRTAYSELGEWDVQAEGNVFFTVGSASLSEKGKKDLLDLAQKAKGHQGYMISVLGFADPTGNAAANERLSNQRAQNVINYLKQNGDLQPSRVLAANAMGEVKLHGAAPDPTSFAEARRVTVRVLTSRAQLPK